MTRKTRNSGKLIKGMPSAVLLSIAIHAILFFLAGALVVFTVVKKREVEFEPPQTVERPKMKLKKPKVRVKKSSRPKSTARIVTTRAHKSAMPTIELPSMAGLGDGLGDGLGGFDMMPDFDHVTMFGANTSVGNDLVGVFYDYKRGLDGKNRSGVDTSGANWRAMIRRFLVQGWDKSVFSRYYRAPKKLYATSLVVPETRSSLAPLAFGDEKAVGALWWVHYEGQLACPATHTNGITFRFWGAADEFMAVRVNGELVLCVSWDTKDRWYDSTFRSPVFDILWNSTSADSWKYYMGNTLAEVGDWITLEPGQALDMEMLIGDNGGKGCFFLAVEEEGVEYERNRQGGPTLPAFRMAELSHAQLDLIYKNLTEGEICLTNGPVFSDYTSSGKAAVIEEPAGNTPPAPRLPQPAASETMVRADAESALRKWILADGRTMEAEFINFFGGKVVLKSAEGKIHKIARDRLSATDVEYAELASPPDLDINFLKKFRHVDFSGGFYDISGWERPGEDWGHCGFQIKQTSPGEYNHELKVEMFVIGKQWRRSKYVVLDHQIASFNPFREEQRSFEFYSDRKIVIALDEFNSYEFGEDYYGYLITVTDARGEIIAMKSSHKWLPKIMENLKKLSVGNFMDKAGVRTYPDRPGKSRFY